MSSGNVILGAKKAWSFLTFSFISPYLLKKYGCRVKLLSGLPELFESDKLDLWVEKFSRAFEEEEINSFHKNKSFSIYRPLFWILWRPICNALLLKLCFDVLTLTSSVILTYFSMSSTKEKTILSSFCIFFLVLGKFFFDCHSRFITSRVCLRVEGSLIWMALDRVVRHKSVYPKLPDPASCSNIDRNSKLIDNCHGDGSILNDKNSGSNHEFHGFDCAESTDFSENISYTRKSMLLRQHEAKFTSSNAANESSNIFNLIIGDASTIEMFFSVFVDFLLLPLRLFMSWYVLSNILGNTSALPAIITFCVVLILSFLFEIIGALCKEPFMVNRDKRIDRCHEVLTEMKSIRLSGLEDVVISRVNESREKELFWNKKRFIYSRIAAFTDYHLKMYSQYVLFMLAFYYSHKGSSSSSGDLVHTGASALQILVLLSSKIRGLPTNIIEGVISLQRYENFIKKYPIDRSFPLLNKKIGNNKNDCLHFFGKGNSRLVNSKKSGNFPISSCLVSETSLLLDKMRVDEGYKDCGERLDADSLYSNKQNATVVLIKNGFFTWSHFKGRRIGEVIVPASTKSQSQYQTPSLFLSNRSRKNTDSNDSLSLPCSYSKNSNSSHEYDDKNHSNFDSGSCLKQLTLSSSLSLSSENSFNECKNNRAGGKSDNVVISESNSNSQIPLTLSNINIKLTLKECIFIIGEPGCGKSSLIKAILGEIRCVSAEIEVLPENNGSIISYSPQSPWIPGGTVRSVILFGREWNRSKYELIIDCCQLREDFLTWQNGDLRTVDEGGSSLSGGQRARISLARALYSLPSACSCVDERIRLEIRHISTYESYLYLFDDVFVSVDLEVGFKIFNRLFGPNGLLLGVSSIVAISSDSLQHYMNGIKHCRDKTDESKICSEFDSFKFSVLVLNSGKTDWIGSYNDYEKSIYSAGISNDVINKNTTNDSVNHNLTRNNVSLSCSTNFNSDLICHESEVSNDLNKTDIPSLNVEDRLDSTDAQFEQLLLTSDSQIEAEDTALFNGKTESRFPVKLSSLYPYKWYFTLLGSNWVTMFVVGCLAKITIDKVLELLFVNNPNEFQKSPFQMNRFSVYASLAILTESFISLCIYLGEAGGGVRAAKKSHEILLYKIIYSPFWFFDVNSVGKILSRFSSDMLAVDNCIVRRITAVFLPFIALIFNFLYVSYKVPLTIPLEFMIIYLILKGIGNKLILTYRDAQRCALLVQSPLCSIFSECLSGSTIIRAFCAEDFYFKKCGSFVDKLERSRLLQHAACQWACIRMQLISAPLTLLVSLIGAFFINNKSSLVLPLIYTIGFAENINDIIFRLISLEKDMCSVARIYEYIKQLDDTNTSQPQIVLGDSAIPDKRIGISISNLEVRYRRPNYRVDPCLLNNTQLSQKLLDEMYFSPTLRNINKFAAPNDHIGIIGRTGSGKSTFIMALFGFVPTTNGKVLLDGVPINQLPNSTRRKVVGVLPQVPLILKGWTVRDFLDPEHKHSSEDLWEALRICCLSNTITSLPGGKMLDTVLVPDIEIRSFNNKSSFGFQLSNMLCFRFNHSRNNYYYNLINNHKGGKFTDNDKKSTQNEKSIDNLVARYLSDSQLRYLSLARLIVNARDYRLILVDEPPPDNFDEHIVGRAYVPVHELIRTNGSIDNVVEPKGIVTQEYLAQLLKNKE
ncbi:hypothetical protein FG386_001799 [Cryptosporidium ryanae]|uniref:uncharacterized protein n=1 Tax=Cryptosporidium ryanae TaxID=515981 RepID=UPI00351A638D|nr:hypothetical protein FG386_001799 [Cryptosporidium ryanae]